ncbi:hypothetical protein [Nocardioides ultimimeridianus]
MRIVEAVLALVLVVVGFGVILTSNDASGGALCVGLLVLVVIYQLSSLRGDLYEYARSRQGRP